MGNLTMCDLVSIVWYEVRLNSGRLTSVYSLCEDPELQEKNVIEHKIREYKRTLREQANLTDTFAWISYPEQIVIRHYDGSGSRGMTASSYMSPIVFKALVEAYMGKGIDEVCRVAKQYIKEPFLPLNEFVEEMLRLHNVTPEMGYILGEEELEYLYPFIMKEVAYQCIGDLKHITCYRDTFREHDMLRKFYLIEEISKTRTVFRVTSTEVFSFSLAYPINQ